MATRVIDLRGMEDDFVVHYGGHLHQVNAFTFANSLLALAESIRTANAIVNPGLDIEIALEALGQGSFRARIRTKKKSLRNLFSIEGAATGVVVSLVANAIWQAAQPAPEPKIIVNDDSVVFEYGHSKVIMPREAYEPHQQVQNVHDFREGIAKAFDELEKDEAITEFGLTHRMEDKEPALHVSRDRFPIISRRLHDDQGTKQEVVRTQLQIVRAILEKSRRMWEFVWKGMRISAPVLDGEFYRKLYKRQIDLATGDVLDVDLLVKQRQIAETGIYENSAYEVRKVHAHTPRPVQGAVGE